MKKMPDLDIRNSYESCTRFRVLLGLAQEFASGIKGIQNMIALVTRHGSFEKGAVSCSSSQHMRNKSALCETAKRHKAQNIKSLWRINASLNTLHSQFT